MPAVPRDLLKTKDAILGEKYTLAHLGAGQANGQCVTFGCTISAGAGNNTITVSAGSFLMGGTEYTIAGLTSQAQALIQKRYELLKRRARSDYMTTLGSTSY